jgi:transcriptional antiterminator Rof (Rho-off)
MDIRLLECETLSPIHMCCVYRYKYRKKMEKLTGRRERANAAAVQSRATIAVHISHRMRDPSEYLK